MSDTPDCDKIAASDLKDDVTVWRSAARVFERKANEQAAYADQHGEFERALVRLVERTEARLANMPDALDAAGDRINGDLAADALVELRAALAHPFAKINAPGRPDAQAPDLGNSASLSREATAGKILHTGGTHSELIEAARRAVADMDAIILGSEHIALEDTADALRGAIGDGEAVEESERPQLGDVPRWTKDEIAHVRAEAGKLADELGVPRSESLPARQEPFCWIRLRDGKPDWAEDCVSEDAHSLQVGNYPPNEGYSVIPLYAAESPAVISSVCQRCAGKGWFMRIAADGFPESAKCDCVVTVTNSLEEK